MKVEVHIRKTGGGNVHIGTFDSSELGEVLEPLTSGGLELHAMLIVTVEPEEVDDDSDVDPEA